MEFVKKIFELDGLGVRTITAVQFEHFRLPETFAGYDRSYSSKPVPYPVACSPQAWAAGAIPYMLQIALGLQPALDENPPQQGVDESAGIE